MSELLADKTALITGASSGIGRAVAMAYARFGVKSLVLCDIQREPREGGIPTDSLVGELGVDAKFVEMDVTDADSTDNAFAVAFDSICLNVVVNCAGVYSSGPLEGVTDSELRRVFAVNVGGTFRVCRSAVRRMSAHGGSIINVSSVASRRGAANRSVYSASKGAVTSMSYALARELAPDGVRVNVITPGAVETAIVHLDDPTILDPVARASMPMGPSQPKDIGSAAVFLASDLSTHVSGTSLTVDGASCAMG